MQVEHDDVVAAHRAAVESRGGTTPPAEGAVGAGTGMSCLGFKGGIGTSSRVTPEGHTVAVLLLTNFGERKRLTVDGVHLGRLLPEDPDPQRPAGSCIGVVVTDAPVLSADCARLARRIGLGLARTGSTAHHGSGEIFLGVSSTRRASDLEWEDGGVVSGRALDDLFEAVVDAAEESVVNSLLTAPTTTGRDGNVSEGLDAATVARLLEEHARGH
jgi:D-aminopeptidase